jgi:hypothetical protein
MVVEPFLKVTVPVGAAPTLSTESVREKVREVPTATLPLGCTVKELMLVTAGVTVKFTAELVLARKLASPGKTAVRLFAPPGSVVVCNSAIPSLARADVPMVAVPLLKVMVPVAAPLGLVADAVWP